MSEFKVFQGTPGPWRWELNKKNKDLLLCGRGKMGPFDLTVMDFERWGMRGAVPRFRDKEGDIMVNANEYGQPVEGRLHHSHWFQDINHPDAKLIAASPLLLNALQKLLRTARGWMQTEEDYAVIKMAEDAINYAIPDEKSNSKSLED